jgi:hypothetical protein
MNNYDKHNPLNSNVMFEFLELMAAAHAPPMGAALWNAGGDLRLVRHNGEPLTVEFCSSLVTAKREQKEVKKLPASIVASYDADSITHLPKYGKVVCNAAVLKAMKEDAVDSDLVPKKVSP